MRPTPRRCYWLIRRSRRDHLERPSSRDVTGCGRQQLRPKPATHYYGFVIDGVLTGDMGGTAVTDRLSRGFLLFEPIDVRGPEPLFTDIRKVAHGAVHIETFCSARLNREVRCFTYKPPGFVVGERLPVAYLLHGDLHDAATWSVTGHAERVADNLIADGQARRVILAMSDTGTPNRRNLLLTRLDTIQCDRLTIERPQHKLDMFIHISNNAVPHCRIRAARL